MHAFLNILNTLVLALLPLAAAAGSLTADRLVYRVEERGIEPYISRFLITADLLRLDEGADQGGYALFDRQAGVVYNVDMQEATVLIIQPPEAALPTPPVALDLGVEELPAPDLSEVEGVTPRHYRLQANGEVCVELTAVEGVMKSATAALAQFHGRLADQHALVMKAYPQESDDACDLAEFIYAPTRRFSHGLPLALTTAAKTEQLVDYDRDVIVDEGLFRVPDGFREIRMPTPPAAE